MLKNYYIRIGNYRINLLKKKLYYVIHPKKINNLKLFKIKIYIRTGIIELLVFSFCIFNLQIYFNMYQAYIYTTHLYFFFFSDSSPLKGEITSVTWNPLNGSQVAVGDESGQIAVKDTRNNNTLFAWNVHKRRIFRMVFSKKQVDIMIIYILRKIM